MKSLLFSVILLIANLSFGQSVAKVQNEVPFSAGDLAIMFPLDKTTWQPKPVVTIGDSQWKVMSAQNLQAILKVAKEKHVYVDETMRDPNKWLLVSMRYSPCIFSVGKLLPCSEQIRFVFQPHNGKVFDDTAIHVLFEFNETLVPMRTERLEGFRKIKNQFAPAFLDKPLGPNELLESSQANAYIQTLNQEIIQKFINTRSASKITFMGRPLESFLDETEVFSPEEAYMADGIPLGNSWLFFAGHLDMTANWHLEKLPTGHNETHVNFTMVGGSGGTDLEPRAGQAFISERAPLSTTEENLRNALLVIDPKKTNDHNTDCASCHIADDTLFPADDIIQDSEFPKKRKQDLLKKAFSIIKNYPRVSEVVVDSLYNPGRQADQSSLVPRIFGYDSIRALISQRMALESAMAVEQANKLLKLSVTVQCVSEKQKKNFLECLYFAADGTVVSCMAKHCH